MSISSEITRIQNKRDQSFTEVANKGVTVPAGSTIDDLPGLIAQIDQGSGSGSGGIIYQDLDGYLNLSEDEANVISIVDTLDTAGGTVRTITGAVESGSGQGTLQVKTGSYTFISDYTVTKINAISWDSSALIISTGLTDIKVISVVNTEMLLRTGEPARPYVGAAIWMRGQDTEHIANYPSNTRGIVGGVIISSSNWDGIFQNGGKLISTHDLNDNCPAGSFAIFAYSTSYCFKAGTTITWEAIGT